MHPFQHILTVTAPRRGLTEVTGEIAAWLVEQPVTAGLLTIFIRHTSASLVIQENADPQVQLDLEAYLDRLVPEDDPLYRHTAEGPDDMPAHVRGALTQTDLQVPVMDGALALGQWQGIFVFEHRRRPRPRELVLHLAGE